MHIGSVSYQNSYFGNGPSPHIISDLTCSSDYKSLLDCGYDFLDAALYCGDSGVAGIVCVGQ